MAFTLPGLIGLATGGKALWDNAQKEGGKKNQAPPQDYTGLAEQQNRANRPNQSTPFGSSSWTQGPDGSWQQNVQFGGPLAGAFGNVQNQLASATANPLDFSGAPALQYGEEARKAAVDSAYGQATSRLDPRFNQEQDRLRQQLANQGLDMTSEAARTAMDDFGRTKNDAYTSAMNMAIGRGAQDAGQMFNQSLGARGQGISEIMAMRNQPFLEAGRMQDFLQMPSFNPATGMVQAAGMEDEFNRDNSRYENQQTTDTIAGGAGLIAQFIRLLAGGA